jgi:hypothetical protein
MYYLATVLGSHSELQFTPVTDQENKLRRLTSFVTPHSKVKQSLDDLRMQILEDVLPAPSRAVPIQEIEFFKRDHGQQLGKFRVD